MFNNETTQMDNNTFLHINLEYMDMMSDGDADMKKTMLEMLIDEMPEEFQKMRNAIQANNWAELASVSHKMKSTLAFVGNDEMTSANKELEMIGKTQEGADNASTLMDTLLSKYQVVEVELKKALDCL